MLRLAIITTHPIQYNAPLFAFLALSKSFQLTLFYTWGDNSLSIYDPGFANYRSWDIDLLNGYDHAFIENVSKDPGSHHFRGIINPDLIQQVETIKPDAIIVYGWKFHSHLKLMRYFKGKIPILFRGDSTLLDSHLQWAISNTLKFTFLKWVYRHVDFALSPGLSSDAYFAACGLRKDQIVRAPHSIDNKRFSEAITTSDGQDIENKAREWRKKIGIPNEAIVILFAGKFESKKDPLVLIQAFKQINKLYSNTHLLLVGSGELNRSIEGAIANSSNSQESLASATISLLPFQNQSVMPIVYRLCDIFVLPSKGPGETWGLSVNEAMACGKPVIVSDKCGCARELVKKDVNGYIFKSGDMSDLVDKMQMMLDKDKLQNMGTHSQDIISEFNYQLFSNALNECFNRIKLEK